MNWVERAEGARPTWRKDVFCPLDGPPRPGAQARPFGEADPVDWELEVHAVCAEL